ncbi:MAG: glycine--tRNA ligase [Planctomycetaceae bacterium]|nr:glycine--tRNA ligase [Planctomycetaceae bacterium]
MPASERSALMDKVVALCKRRGFIFQSSEIYGGLNGFWDYGPLGVELKRNVRNAWWQDMVGSNDPWTVPDGAPTAYHMVGVETSIIMHPQVWKCSGHYDMFVDKMVDCRESKSRYRVDHVKGRWIEGKVGDAAPARLFLTAVADGPELDAALTQRALKLFGMRSKEADKLQWQSESTSLATLSFEQYGSVIGPEATQPGTLTAPRDFNLMFKTILGALGTDADAAFLRPETAQGMFVNFKNVCDSTRVKVPFGIAQIGKSFRNEITPRNFTFRSREFEQMEMEFFCHPSQSRQWYEYWRDFRYNWYVNLGIKSDRLQLRDHAQDELSHYSVGTADVEYAFPFLDEGEFGELEGVAHRGDFDLRSHMEGKLVKDAGGNLVVEQTASGEPKYRGSGKDLAYFDDQTREKFVPHVIEPAAGADRATLAFICEAYAEDSAPDDKGQMQTRVVMRFHPRLAPVKAAVFPLVKKDGQPEQAREIYLALKRAGIAAAYDEQAAIGKRYRRQDEIGTPWCFTVDNQTLVDGTVTLRERDSLEQTRIPATDVVAEVQRRLA